MRRSSSSSAGATYLNRAERLKELRRAAERAKAVVPSISRIVLFGSLVSGTPTPRSDADLLVVVQHSPHPDPRDRLPEILRALKPLPCPVDVFVLTRDEVERGRVEGSPLLREALEQGADLLSED